MTVDERIKSVREKAGISQVDFAARMNVSKQTLYKYENNILTNIPSDKIEAAAKICNVSPAYLMGWIDIAEENKPTKEEFPKVKRKILKALKTLRFRHSQDFIQCRRPERKRYVQR